MIRVDQYSGFMSRETCAKFLDCSVDTVDNLRKKGYLIPRGHKGFWRYDPHQVIAGINRLTRDRRRFKINKENERDVLLQWSINSLAEKDGTTSGQETDIKETSDVIKEPVSN